MANKVEQLEERIVYIENILGNLVGSDRYTIQKTIQMFDERNFQLGKNVGTKFGTETSQLLAFYGNTAVNQPDTVADPNNQGGSYVQSDVQSIVGKVNEIIDRLQELGLIA